MPSAKVARCLQRAVRRCAELAACRPAAPRLTEISGDEVGEEGKKRREKEEGRRREGGGKEEEERDWSTLETRPPAARIWLWLRRRRGGHQRRRQPGAVGVRESGTEGAIRLIIAGLLF